MTQTSNFLTTALFALCAITPLAAQDYYDGRREEWLRKAEADRPQLRETQHRPIRCVEILADTAAYQGWKAEGRPGNLLYNTSMNDQSGIVADFGEHLTGYVSFSLASMDVTPGAPVRLKFTFAETPAELGISFADYAGSLGRAWLQDEVVTVMTIGDTITIPRRLSFRYARIEVMGRPHYNFCFTELICRAVTSAVTTPAPLPAGIDPLIRDIDRVGLATLRECMQTVYEDGPKRDQRLWIGDLYLEALANDCSYLQHGLTRRCLYLLAGCSDLSGVLAGTLFERPEPHAQHKQFLLDYSLLYNVTLKNYLTATGDRQTAEELWPVATRQLANVMPYLLPSGLLDYERAVREWWVFFDWRDGLHKEVALQGLTIFAFRETLELGRMLGRDKEVIHLKALIEKMTSAARKHYLDRRTGLFVGTTSDQISCSSQVWMVLGGIASPKEGQRALHALQQTTDAIWPGTPYAMHYYIQALIDSGLHAEALTALTDYWGGMVRKGADTFWEAYSPDDDFLSPYGFSPMNSYCHAWSCTPVYFIRKYPEIFQQKL